ncbi:c-type cytochrome [Luteimonas aquatica]|uniref:c-type cytochrome n=1 Tax=Luteimonas aquatica TaxID=450364 RepID=UPI001F562430|nr:cytochrome c [Luteimonas aquatica]
MTSIAKTFLAAGVVLGLLAAGGAVALYSGAYNVGADVPHTRPVYALLDIARERSIASRARQLQVPPGLDDPANIRQGAGNYAAMCVGCHLAPGMPDTELRKGLYPQPPDLTQEDVAAAEAFWTIKHGIKASGMPAWGRSMDDPYIWNMVAFLRVLPKLDKVEYDALVAGSGGHSHGGGETSDPPHSGGTDGHHHDAGMDAAKKMATHGEADHHASHAGPHPGSAAALPAAAADKAANDGGGTERSPPPGEQAEPAHAGHAHQH